MYKIEFELKPFDFTTNCYNSLTGSILRGKLMNIFKERDSRIPHDLHAFNKIREYSLFIINHPKKQEIIISLIFFNDKYANLILNYLKEVGQLNFNGYSYDIFRILEGPINLNEIIKNIQPISNFNMRFLTPTYFNTINGNYPIRVPTTKYIFSNLTNLWNTLSKIEFEILYKKTIAWIKAHLYISGHNIRTVPVILKKKQIAGFIGNVSFRVKKPNKKYYEKIDDKEIALKDYKGNCKILDLLCKFGEYSNLGANRTAGLGKINYVPKK